MSASDSYYQHQATARSLNSQADVESLTDLMGSCYDRLLSPWLPTPRNAAIYEVACGPGVMLRYLRRQGYTNFSGSDMAECQIELAKAAGLPVVLGDSIQELRSQPDGCWDCIIAIDFIEHLPKEVLIEFFAQCNRTLKKGGRLILRGPNADGPLLGRNLFNDITHIWAYTTVALQALLKIAGFNSVEFADESLASLQRHRWIKVPMMKVAQGLLRLIIRSATREEIKYFSPSVYIVAFK